MHRELLEEGKIVATGPAELLGIYLNRKASRRDHVAVYVLRDIRQNGPRPPDREIVEAGFFALDSLPPETTPATRRRIQEATQGLQPPATW
jgi:hypothetical protein